MGTRRPAGEIYLPLAVGFASDPKVRALAQFGPDAGLARDLFVQMCCHCKEQLTDGFVAEYELGILVYPLDIEHGKQLAKHLAYVGLIKELSNGQADGWQVCAFLKRNLSREQVAERSKVRAEAGRKGGQKSRKPARQAAPKATGKQVASNLASKKTPRDRDRDYAELPYGSSGADAPGANPAPIVAAFIEGATAAGLKRPAASILARVGKQARELLAENTYTPDELIASARRMGAGEWNDLGVQLRIDNAAGARSESGGMQPSVYSERAAQAVQAGIEAERIIAEMGGAQ